MLNTGLARLLADPTAILRRQRVGLLCHAASVASDLSHALDAMLAHPAIDLRAAFGPQHGVTSHTQDNMIEWQTHRDARTGLPWFSLYGRERKPTAEMLDGLDTIVVDLQDVGTRVYTFVWTMALVMQACAEAGRRVVVLDRPNPIGGALEGPMLLPGFESFVGLHPIPLRHGLTIGELALYLHRHCGLGCDLEVVWMDGWRRSMWFDQTGLPWVIPSPNMPTLETAAVYPGAVLFEGTQLSEGRGTTRPFEILGGPGIDGHELAAAMHREDLPGVRFRPLHFEPTFQKHAEVGCGGVQLHVTDRLAFAPVITAAVLMREMRRWFGDRFAWLDPPYEYIDHLMPIDILAGGSGLRLAVERGDSAGAMLREWRAERAGFESRRDDVLRYPD